MWEIEILQWIGAKQVQKSATMIELHRTSETE